MGAVRANNYKGTVWVVFLNAAGSVKTQTEITQNTGGFTGAVETSDWFTWSVAASDAAIVAPVGAGALTTLAVGTPGDDSNAGGYDQGAVWLLSLSSSGAVAAGPSAQVKISSTTAGMEGQLQNGDYFGRSVMWLPDLNGDARQELVVGGPDADLGGLSTSGALWVLGLSATGSISSLQRISGASGGGHGFLHLDSRLGSSLAAHPGSTSFPDTSPWRHPVVFAGMPAIGTNTIQDTGHVWLLQLVAVPESALDPATVITGSKISDTRGNFTGGMQNQEYFGSAVASIPDIDGNGQGDVAVGSPYRDRGGFS